MRRRRLAAELQRLRAASRRTLDEVAEYLECSPAKVSRIENAQVAVRIQDARDLLDLYQVTDERREVLLQMVRQARSKGWWVHYSDVVEEGMETLLSLEDEAVAISIYETNLVAGLLQTRDYAHALMDSWNDVPLDQMRRRLDLRMERQEILVRPEPPRVDLVLDESCLRRIIGSRALMVEQYNRLLRAAVQEHVTVRILAFDAGPHQAMGFPFQIFEFSGEDPSIVAVELLNRNEFIETAEEIGRYRAAFTQARERALSPEDSITLLKRLAEND
ncbi:helix-turn-helix domain-containing protein [Actinoallomurus soli]|uniref:helix-turn-helix domain-containing protein n=1 Tax=Actinoallomurus soli TaxID=2952535 RepID=UPI0020923B23|nr:helix-turn-helix transcriptional regulator [Actinoallomurus soli]MCO5968309.1 helix-turn-helix domain-containing protein [Actinoallomurus soli]